MEGEAVVAEVAADVPHPQRLPYKDTLVVHRRLVCQIARYGWIHIAITVIRKNDHDHIGSIRVERSPVLTISPDETAISGSASPSRPCGARLVQLFVFSTLGIAPSRARISLARIQQKNIDVGEIIACILGASGHAFHFLYDFRRIFSYVPLVSFDCMQNILTALPVKGRSPGRLFSHNKEGAGLLAILVAHLVI